MARRSRAHRTSYMAAPPAALAAALPDAESADPDLIDYESGDPLLGFVPVPHVAPRRNSITAERQRAFIAHLAATGIVRQAARHIGASLEALYKLRQRPGAQGFAAAWDEAVDRGVQRLEDCALARAIEGEERLVVSAGKVVGTERRHNEALVMFLLRQRRAARYGSELRPGHPVYERIRGEVLAGVKIADDDRTEEEVYAEIDLFLDNMRVRIAENTALIEGDPPTYGAWTDDDDGEDAGADDEADGEAGDTEKDAG